MLYKEIWYVEQPLSYKLFVFIIIIIIIFIILLFRTAHSHEHFTAATMTNVLVISY